MVFVGDGFGDAVALYFVLATRGCWSGKGLTPAFGPRFALVAPTWWDVRGVLLGLFVQATCVVLGATMLCALSCVATYCKLIIIIVLCRMININKLTGGVALVDDWPNLKTVGDEVGEVDMRDALMKAWARLLAWLGRSIKGPAAGTTRGELALRLVSRTSEQFGIVPSGSVRSAS